MVRKKLGRPDWSLLATVILITLLGIILVYDSSVVRASNVFGGKYYFLILQSLWAIFGFFILLLTLNLDSAFLKWLPRRLFWLSLILLLLTVLPRFLPSSLRSFVEIFVPSINGSHRWIFINPKPLPSFPLVGRVGFQPSELAKIGLVFYLASFLANPSRKFPFLKVVFSIGILSGLTLMQPDFGTALIIGLTGIIIYLMSGAPLKNLIFLILPFFFLSLFFVWTSPYRRERLMSYLSPSTETSLSSRYQINQVLIALGSGGLTGVGLGQSRQKYDYIPEVNTDSIFAIIGEETGLIGTGLVLLIYLHLIYRALAVSWSLGDRFAALLALGIAVFLGLQTFINLSGMTHLLPLTGVTLPLISYGGSSLLVNMFSLGVLLNVSRLRKEK